MTVVHVYIYIYIIYNIPYSGLISWVLNFVKREVVFRNKFRGLKFRA